MLQGIDHDAILLAVEDFGSHEAALAAVPRLDMMRPHLGRSLALAAKMRTIRQNAVVKGLEAANVAAAVVDTNRKMRASNALFEKRMRDVIIDPHGKVRFLIPAHDAALDQALAKPGKTARSLAIPGTLERAPLVLHVLPLIGLGRDVFGSDGILLMIADGENRILPAADLLRTLFDYTPAEARLARALLEGKSVAEASRALRITQGTARVQLRGVFAKTGVSRQADLLRHLLGFVL